SSKEGSDEVSDDELDDVSLKESSEAKWSEEG
ncbi:hypothetical protein Tco_0631990, partial [Tanacetum coccineum]